MAAKKKTSPGPKTPTVEDLSKAITANKKQIATNTKGIQNADSTFANQTELNTKLQCELKKTREELEEHRKGHLEYLATEYENVRKAAKEAYDTNTKLADKRVSTVEWLMKSTTVMVTVVIAIGGIVGINTYIDLNDAGHKIEQARSDIIEIDSQAGVLQTALSEVKATEQQFASTARNAIRGLLFDAIDRFDRIMDESTEYLGPRQKGTVADLKRELDSQLREYKSHSESDEYQAATQFQQFIAIIHDHVAILRNNQASLVAIKSATTAWRSVNTTQLDGHSYPWTSLKYPYQHYGKKIAAFRLYALGRFQILTLKGGISDTDVEEIEKTMTEARTAAEPLVGAGAGQLSGFSLPNRALDVLHYRKYRLLEKQIRNGEKQVTAQRILRLLEKAQINLIESLRHAQHPQVKAVSLNNIADYGLLKWKVRLNHALTKNNSKKTIDRIHAQMASDLDQTQAYLDAARALAQARVVSLTYVTAAEVHVARAKTRHIQIPTASPIAGDLKNVVSSGRLLRAAFATRKNAFGTDYKGRYNNEEELLAFLEEHDTFKILFTLRQEKEWKAELKELLAISIGLREGK